MKIGGRADNVPPLVPSQSIACFDTLLIYIYMYVYIYMHTALVVLNPGGFHGCATVGFLYDELQYTRRSQFGSISSWLVF